MKMMTVRNTILTALATSLALVLTAPAYAASPASEWYMKMTVLVEAGEELYWDDRSGVFGRLRGASWKADVHDIPVFTPAEQAQVAIAFDVRGSEEDSQFLSDYRPRGKNRKTWNFTVYTQQPEGRVTLVWDGLYVLEGEAGDWEAVLDNTNRTLRNLSLVDRETGEVVEAFKSGQLQSYSFDMNGKTKRHFRWVQNKLRANDRRLQPAEAVQQVQSVQAQGVREGTLGRKQGVQANEDLGLPPLPGKLQRQLEGESLDSIQWSAPAKSSVDKVD